MDETRLIERAAAFAKNRNDFHDLAKEENKAIGVAFKCVRRDRKISLRVLAEKVGVSHAMIASWERGESFWDEGIAKRYIESCR